MSKEFQYSQRPFSKQLTDEQYDRAVGRIKPITAAPTQTKRNRVYAFLRLPSHAQRARAITLGLWNATDQGLNQEAQIREWSARAKSQGKLDELFSVTLAE